MSIGGHGGQMSISGRADEHQRAQKLYHQAKGACNPHCGGSAMGLCWVQPRPSGAGAGPGGQTGGLQADEHQQAQMSI